MNDPSRPETSITSQLLDTTPAYPEPDDASIEAAARDLPLVLEDMENTPHIANDPPINMIHRAVRASDLVAELGSKKGHAKGAAAHTVHRLVQNGMLLAEPVVQLNLKTVHNVGSWKPGTILPRSAIQGGPEGHIRLGAVVETTEPIPPTPGTPVWDGTGPVPYDRLLIRSTQALWDARRAGSVTIRAITTDTSRQFQERQNATLAAVAEYEKQKAVLAERNEALKAWQIEKWPEFRDAAEALTALWNLNEVVRFPPPNDSEPYAAWIPHILTYGHFIRRNGLAHELDRPNRSISDQFAFALFLAAANGASEAELHALLEARYMSGFLASDFTWQHVFNSISGLVGQHFNQRTRREFPDLFPASQSSSPVPVNDVNPNVEVVTPNKATDSPAPPDTEKIRETIANNSTGKRGKNIDAQMLKALQDDHSKKHWSAKKWSEFLNCGKGTVGESKTWKENIMGARALEAAARASRGNEGLRRDDRRRGRPK